MPVKKELDQKGQPAARKGATERSLLNFLAGSHGALQSGYLTQSRYALQFNTPEMEKKVWSRVVEGKPPEPITFDEALQETSFGCFQVFLFLACGITYMACGASVSTLSFTLPASTCDLNISSFDKGGINTAPYVGMILGTFAWGALSDTRGRKSTLITCLLIDAFSSVAAGLSMNKWMLIISRTFNGFSIIGATSLVFAFFGEFLTAKQSDQMLAAIELFYSFGMIFIPCLGWLILPQPINIGPYHGVFIHSWNVFTAATSITSFVGAGLIMCLPETPKFMMHSGNFQATLKTLQKMYGVNKRTAGTNLPVTFSEDRKRSTFFEEGKVKFFKAMKLEVLNIVDQHKEILTSPFRYRILATCLVDFSFSFGYLSLVIWIPEMLERTGNYQKMYDSEATVCQASRAMAKFDVSQGKTKCNSKIEEAVYLHVIIITAVCIPVVILAFTLLRWISKKIILSLFIMVAGISTMMFNHVKHDYLLITLCASFESSAPLLETLLFICTIEMFPTQLAGTALALTACSGRVGAIIGQIFIGSYLDNFCEMPLYLFGLSFLFGSLGCLFLPVT